MKYLYKILIVLFFFSCASNDIAIETGELNNGVYKNNSLGLTIKYEEALLSPFTTDSLNRMAPFDQIKKGSINFKNNTEALLIGFHDNSENNDIMLTLLNKEEVRLAKVKDYIINSNTQRVEKHGVKLKIESSGIEQLDINGVDYEYFSATYTILEQNFTQKSIYAFKQLNDFILLTELPITSGTGDRSPDKSDLVKFLKNISYTNQN